MDKERERVFKKAMAKQRRYFSGEPGSAKNLAYLLLHSLREFAVCPTSFSPKIEAELLELSRQNMVKALANCDSELFWNITAIATALARRDSKFFSKLAAGLNQLPSTGYYQLPVDELIPMQFVQQAYFYWMLPQETIWALPDYQRDISSGAEPFKWQMKKLTKRFWAVARLIKQGDIELCLPTEKQPDDVETKIDKEIDDLPTQNWRRLWIEAGLDHLPEGKAGRPRKKT